MTRLLCGAVRLLTDRLGPALHRLLRGCEVDARNHSEAFDAGHDAKHPRFERIGAAPLVDLRPIAVAHEREVQITTVRGQEEAIEARDEARLLLALDPRAKLHPR